MEEENYGFIKSEKVEDLNLFNVLCLSVVTAVHKPTSIVVFDQLILI